MLNQEIRCELALGRRDPQTFEELRFRKQFRKRGAVPGSGFPGLTRKEMDIVLERTDEVVMVNERPHGKFLVVLDCGHSMLCDKSVDPIRGFLPDRRGPRKAKCPFCNAK